MKLRDLSVRYRLLLNNVIMVLIPVLLLVGIGSAVFHGLRATGNFREREMEILWPEAGDTIPVLLGLSHLFPMSTAVRMRNWNATRSQWKTWASGWRSSATADWITKRSREVRRP